jgi:hypothetical protein
VSGPFSGILDMIMPSCAITSGRMPRDPIFFKSLTIHHGLMGWYPRGEKLLSNAYIEARNSLFWGQVIVAMIEHINPPLAHDIMVV